MLPSNAISATAAIGDYLSPDDGDFLLLESFEEGGVALNDASQGRQVQTWRAWHDSGAIKCAPISGTPETTLIGGLGAVTALSIAFDSAMQPTLCFIENGVLKLRWFNTVTELFQVDSFSGTSGKVSTDDKRRAQEGASDVIFAYTRGGSLYWRQQRDRYTVERLVGVSGTQILNRLGMTNKNRLQFELTEAS